MRAPQPLEPVGHARPVALHWLIRYRHGCSIGVRTGAAGQTCTLRTGAAQPGQTCTRPATALTISATASYTGTPFFCCPLRYRKDTAPAAMSSSPASGGFRGVVPPG